MNEEPITVNIHDLGVAAALVACDFEILDIKQNMSGRTYFIFQETAALDEVANSYYADTLHVKARKYFENIKMLKGRIYADK